MNVDEILDAMDEAIDKAKQMPFSGGKCIIDCDNFRELIAQVRMSLPGEIKQAQALVSDRKIIINNAKAEADTIIRKAEEKAKKMVDESTITTNAQQRANEILTTTSAKSKEIRNATNEYVENMLRRVDELLTNDLNDVRKTRAALKNGKNGQ